jgi:hypothetical protein
MGLWKCNLINRRKGKAVWLIVYYWKRIISVAAKEPVKQKGREAV